jgi:hypothetical protein
MLQQFCTEQSLDSVRYTANRESCLYENVNQGRVLRGINLPAVFFDREYNVDLEVWQI